MYVVPSGENSKYAETLSAYAEDHGFSRGAPYSLGG